MTDIKNEPTAKVYKRDGWWYATNSPVGFGTKAAAEHVYATNAQPIKNEPEIELPPWDDQCINEITQWEDPNHPSDWTCCENCYKLDCRERQLREALAKIAQLEAERDALRERVETAEQGERYAMWLSHEHKILYGDDGEMQCRECRMDYKTEPLDMVRAAYKIAQMKKLTKALNKSTE